MSGARESRVPAMAPSRNRRAQCISQSLVTEELIAVLRDPATHSGAWATFAAVWRNDPGPRPEPLSRSLALPMLLPWGECDPWTPLAGAVGRSFARLAEDRPDVTPAPLPRTGHW